MNKRYFSYLFKSTKSVSVVMLIAFLFIVPFITLLIQPGSFISSGTPNYALSGAERSYSILSFAIFFTAYYYHSIFLKKRSADLYFSLPITKKEISITTMLFNFVQVISIWTISYWLNVCVLLLKGIPFAYVYFLYYYLISLVLISFTLSFANFGFAIANNMIDALFSSATFATAVAAVIFVITAGILMFIVIPLNLNGNIPLIIQETINWLLTLLPNNTLLQTPIYKAISGTELNIVDLSKAMVNLALTIAYIPLFTYLTIHFNSKFRSEKAEEISDNKYGLHSHLQIIAFAAFTFIGYGFVQTYDRSLTITIMFIVLLSSILIYFAFMFSINRKISFNKKTIIPMLIIFSSSMVYGIILGVVSRFVCNISLF